MKLGHPALVEQNGKAQNRVFRRFTEVIDVLALTCSETYELLSDWLFLIPISYILILTAQQ